MCMPTYERFHLNFNVRHAICAVDEPDKFDSSHSFEKCRTYRKFVDSTMQVFQSTQTPNKSINFPLRDENVDSKIISSTFRVI